MPNPRNMRPVLLIHKRDGHVVARYPSIKDAADAVGCDRSDLSRRASDRKVSGGEVIARFEDEWTGIEDFEARRRNRPVIAMSGRKLAWFADAGKAAEALGVTRDSVIGKIHRGKGADGIRLRYATGTDDWPRLREAAGKIGGKR